MGASNFSYNSDYITMTYIMDPYDLMKDSGYVEDIKSILMDNGYEEDEITDDMILDRVYDDANFYTEQAWEDAERVIKANDTGCIYLSLESGYYEGIELIISADFPDTFDNEDQREETFKDIAGVAEVLTELADMGWDGDDEDIADAISGMLADVQAIPVDDWDEPDHDWG